MSSQFTPSYTPHELFNYAKFYGHVGKNKFHGTYDEERYYKFLEQNAGSVSEEVWPYSKLDDDFYTFNSVGYRTYEFSDLQPGEFDLAVGCSYVEGLGLRQQETWLHHYEQLAGVQLVNLGKGGGSNTSTKFSLLSWLLGVYPKPRKILVLWTEPSRDTFVRQSGSLVSLNPGWNKIHHTLHHSDHIINILYQTSLQDNLIWSNRFIETFSMVNLLAKGFDISLYNFFPDIFWSGEDVKNIQSKTSFSSHSLNFNNVAGGWAKFKNYDFYPAADGVHHGWQHQMPLAQDIHKVTHEEN